MTPHFWPSPKVEFPVFSSRPIQKVESFFSKLYSPYHVVLFSSSRVSLTAILAVEGVSKIDTVQVPLFSSNCVLKAVSQITLGEALARGGTPNKVVYHQMGVPYELAVPVLIEDSVDSLCLSPNALFPSNGKYEMFSLPKIVGCGHGGIVVCRDRLSAQALRDWRDSHSTGAWLNDALRGLKQFSQALANLWEATNHFSPRPGNFAASSILASLNRWEAIVSQRRERLERLRSIIPCPWRLTAERLPCALPVRLEDVSGGWLAAHTYLVRHFYVDQALRDFQLERFIALPIHQGVSDETFETIVMAARGGAA